MGEGIVTTNGSEASYKSVIGSPDSISKCSTMVLMSGRQIRETKAATSGDAAATRVRVAAKAAKKGGEGSTPVELR